MECNLYLRNVEYSTEMNQLVFAECMVNREEGTTYARLWNIPECVIYYSNCTIYMCV